MVYSLYLSTSYSVFDLLLFDFTGVFDRLLFFFFVLLVLLPLILLL